MSSGQAESGPSWLGVLDTAAIYLRHEDPQEVAVDPAAKWRVVKNLLDVARYVRRRRGDDGLQDVLTSALGDRVAVLGFNGLFADLVASALGPRLVGAVHAAHLAAEEANRQEPKEQPTTAVTTTDTEGQDPGPSRSVLVVVSSVQAERVEWEWMHRAPRGKVTVLDGDPGLGKSTVALDLGARRTRGLPMPGDDRQLEPAGAVFLTAEDGIADTLRPRLEAAGADLDRVAVLTGVRDEEGRPRLPVIPDDVEAVREAVRRMRARLLVIDPLMAFLNGRVDSHRDQDVRGALALLSDLAEQERIAVIIIRHLNKTGGGHPIYRGGGSIGIIGAARAGLLVAPDPKDHSRRVLAVSKSNLGPIPPSLAYRLVAAGDTSKVEWEGITECSAGDLLAAQWEDGEGAGPRAEAEEFLRALLSEGPVRAKKIRTEAEGAGLSWITVRRAADRLGVTREKAGGHFGGDPAWYWSLKVLTKAEDDLPRNESTFRGGEHLQKPRGAEDPDSEVLS